MKLTFLESSRPLVKSFSLDETGAIQKESYPLVSLYTSHSVEISTLAEMVGHMKLAADKGWCLLKGNTARPLVNETRAGSTSAIEPTSWVCLDLDRLVARSSNYEADIEWFLDALGVGKVSYILQWSASMGIEQDDLIRAHIFIRLDEAVLPSELKRLLEWWNLRIEVLRRSIALAASGVALKWPLDVSTCQNDKLLYIAPPRLGRGVRNWIHNTKRERIVLVEKEASELSIKPLLASIDEAKLKAEKKAMIEELGGKSVRLAKRGDLEYMPIPQEQRGAVRVTGLKRERGFVYFNLNDGDSWGYYHPDDNPEFLYNFKGEPTYLTKELLPEYYQANYPGGVSKTVVESVEDADLHFAFIHKDTADYYGAHWTRRDGVEDLDLVRLKGKAQSNEWLARHGQPKQDALPFWEIRFDPDEPRLFVPEEGIVNTCKPAPRHVPVADLPPLAKRVLESCVGTGDTLLRFLNWLAFIYQRRTRTRQAWILHGVPGTGKGVLYANYILPTLAYANEISSNSLLEQWNNWMHNKFLVMIDEAEMREKREEQVMAKLKNYITEPMIQIRQHYSPVFSVPNHCNFMFASNKPDPVFIDVHDRRFSVADYGASKLEVKPGEVDRLAPKELERFYGFMMSYPVDDALVHTPYISEARTNMQALSATSVETAIRAVREGDLAWLIEQVPSSIKHLPNLHLYHAFLEQLVRIADWVNQTPDKAMPMLRDEIGQLLGWCVDELPKTPNKLTRMLNLHHLFMTSVWKDGGTWRGTHVQWHCDPALLAQFLRQHGSLKGVTNAKEGEGHRHGPEQGPTSGRRGNGEDRHSRESGRGTGEVL